MQELNKGLYELTRSKYRPILREYLEKNKEIIEDHLYNSKTGYIEKPTNGAVVLIKMREVYNEILELPKKLEKLIESNNVSDELYKTAKEVIEKMS